MKKIRWDDRCPTKGEMREQQRYDKAQLRVALRQMKHQKRS